MLTPLKQWYCDVCGDVIECIEDGYVIWKRDDQYREYAFKIIHKVRCDLKDHSCSMALHDFLGEDGLAYVLAFLSLGPVKHSLGQTHHGVADIDEFVDLVRRVQTPYYEEARTHFDEEQVMESLSDANEVYPYLRATCEKLARQADA